MSEAITHHPATHDPTLESDRSSTPSRWPTYLKWGSVAMIALGLLVLMRQEQDDLSRAVRMLGGFLQGQGLAIAIAIFAGLYIVATVAMAPGLILTIAAGAIFGLLWGTVAVSIGSTLGAALAFLIARYFARDKVARVAQRHARFRAIDRAISEGGWKIVGLLRLSPAIPFNLQNYLYGLTAIRFWPYVLISWLAMLPGTFMYVYIGYIGREGAEAAAGAGAGVGQWVLRIVGFAATVAVTVYVTKLARQALKRQAGLEPEPAEATDRSPDAPETRESSGMVSTLIAALLAAAVLILNACVYTGALDFGSLLGPPSVVMTEAYERKPDGPRFDHSLFDGVVSRYVSDEGGWVDYRGLAENPEPLNQYIEQVAHADFEALGRDEKLALLINAYNAFTLKLIIEYLPQGIDSIKDIAAEKRWDDVRWQIGQHTWSLNQIEHEQIRPKFKEPRIHFALVCAAIGCPPLRNEAYTGDRIEQQLEDQTVYIHRHDRWFGFDPQQNVVHLTPLYDWYGSDFEQVADSVLDYVARYSPELAGHLEDGRKPSIRWLNYDWTLNGRAYQPASQGSVTP